MVDPHAYIDTHNTGCTHEYIHTYLFPHTNSYLAYPHTHVDSHNTGRSYEYSYTYIHTVDGEGERFIQW